MVLTLEYLDQGGKSQSFWVRNHEVVKVGSSVHADQQIEDDPDLDKVHFLIRFEENAWIIESTSVRPLQLNGAYTRLSVLKAGDRIQAGNTKFNVNLPLPEDTTSLSEETSIASPQIRATNEFIAWWQGLVRDETLLRAEIIEHRIEGAVDLLPELIPHLRSLGTATLLWNRKSYGNPSARLPGWNIQAADLFAEAPEEIRKEHALSAGSIDWNTLAPIELADVLFSDCALLLFHRTPTSELIEKKKIAWAWFVRPSLLQFHLRNGSELLVGKLMEDIELVATVSESRTDLIFHLHRETSSQFPILTAPSYTLG